MTDEKLLELALDARKNAYVPYSGYAVGAALLAEDGRVFTGCNVENAAYGNTLCAERTALVKAVSEGCRRFTKIAIASAGSAPYPCGACRQSLYEFAPELEVLVTWDGNVARAPLGELLPHGFGPSSLGKYTPSVTTSSCQLPQGGSLDSVPFDGWSKTALFEEHFLLSETKQADEMPKAHWRRKTEGEKR